MNACFYPLLLIAFWYLAVCPFSRRGLSDDSVKGAPAKPPTSKNNAEKYGIYFVHKFMRALLIGRNIVRVLMWKFLSLFK